MAGHGVGFGGAPAVVGPIIDWYSEHARDLPWRAPGVSGWAVLVSEVMLQQTPVSRVLPAYRAWLERWPSPPDLVADAPGEAVLAWDRLGYPRRALRLHEAAVVISERHGGVVPAEHAALLALPGVGDYTAAAVAAFAYGRRHVVLDTNVRRVLGRVVDGRALPPAAVRAAERATAAALLPADAAVAARWSVAAMELGALVCRARAPRCNICPVTDRCAWRAAGRPPPTEPRLTQSYEGTDRQARGRLLAALRAASPQPVDATTLARCWDEPLQRARALDSLVADGLLDPLPDGRFSLPGQSTPPPPLRPWPPRPRTR